MIKHLLLILLSLALISGISPAQEEAEYPLLQLLAMVPDTRGTEMDVDIVTYNDFVAAAQSRPGIIRPANMDEFEQGMDSDDPGIALWFRSLPSGLPQAFIRTFFSDDETTMRDVVGFEWFDVDQVIYFGLPPGQGLILQGRFDTAAIDTAFAARDFIQDTLNGMNLWCGPNGCEDGFRIDIESRNILNPFGGHIGRQEPLIVTENYLLNSPSYDLLQLMALSPTGDWPSLAQVADYRAAAESLIEEGLLIEAQFVPAALTSVFDVTVLLNDEERDAFIEAFSAHGSLPPYTLVVLGSTVDAEKQYATLTLVFNDESSAQAAAQVAYDRFVNMSSLQTKLPFVDIVAGMDGTIETPRVIQHEETGKWLTIFTLSAPLPEDSEAETGFGPPTIGILYRFFLQSLAARDVFWLGVGNLE